MSSATVIAIAESNPLYPVPCWPISSYSATYWTPVILLNSPYGGNATAESSVSYTGEYTIAGYTSSTTSTNGISISAFNGGAVGYFEEDTWTYYHYSNCPDKTVITYRSGIFNSYNLLPPNSMSEDNEIHNFILNGIPSVYFNNQYAVNNDGSQGTCSGPGFTLTITTTSTTSESVRLSFAGGQIVSVGVLDIGISGGSSNTNSFEYTFPSNFGTWYLDSHNGQSGSANQGALGFWYVPCSGGGGVGCVLDNSLILLSNGSTVPVQKLKAGDMVKSYDILTHNMIDVKVTGNSAKIVNQIVDINNGQLFMSGLTDQPMYVQLQNGSINQIELGQLTAGMKLFSAMTGTWVRVTSIQILNGNYTVYDLRTTSGNYIANGFVILVK
ncbi:MAG: Hint domain-containing protein [Conexivisphaerales archaeon]